MNVIRKKAWVFRDELPYIVTAGIIHYVTGKESDTDSRLIEIVYDVDQPFLFTKIFQAGQQSALSAVSY
jgi:hypothetical protein